MVQIARSLGKKPRESIFSGLQRLNPLNLFSPRKAEEQPSGPELDEGAKEYCSIYGGKIPDKPKKAAKKWTAPGKAAAEMVGAALEFCNASNLAAQKKNTILELVKSALKLNGPKDGPSIKFSDVGKTAQWARRQQI